MKRIKARNFQEFFASHMGQAAWKRGMALYQMSGVAKKLPDGQYRTQLCGAWFEVPKKGGPLVMFRFQVLQEPSKGAEIHKAIPADSPQGISALLQDYKLLSAPFDDDSPLFIERTNSLITQRQPVVLLALETNQDGIQVARVLEADWGATSKPAPKAPKMPVEPPPAPEEPKPQEAAERPPEPAPEPVETTTAVDLQVGMRIRYLWRGEAAQRTGIIKAVYEEEQEVAVLDEATGSKVLVGGDAIKGILALS